MLHFHRKIEKFIVSVKNRSIKRRHTSMYVSECRVELCTSVYIMLKMVHLDQTRPDRTRPDRTGQDQTRPN